MKSLKWIGIGIVLAVLTAVAVSGTLGDQSANDSYLTIVQSELERSGTELRQVADNRELLPVIEDQLTAENILLKKDFSATDKKNNTVNVSLFVQEQMYNAENVLDHIVVVTNTGNTDGYVRTWFAFEMGDLTEEEYKASVLLNQNNAAWKWNSVEYGVVIDSERYAVVCAEYTPKLSAGETTAPNLLQILLKSNVSGDIVSRLDGNKDGKYEVRAYSQVVSDDGAWSQVSKPWGMQ